MTVLDDLTPGWRLLADAGWQSTLLMAAGLLVAAMLQRRHPGRAHSVLVAAAMAAVLAPAMAAAVRGLGMGLLPAGALAGPSGAGPDASWTTPGAASPADTHPWLTSRAVLSIVAAAWIVTSGVLLVRLGVAVRRAHRLVAQTRAPGEHEIARLRDAAARADLDPLPTVRVHPRIASPATWRTRCDGAPGRCDVLLLPDHLLTLPAGELAAILAHEVAHVRRRDQRHALGLALVTAILPWQPLAWAIRRRATAAREAACDATAARVLDSPARYAHLLCRLVSPRPPATQPLPAGGLVVAMAAGTVRARVDRLLGGLADVPAPAPAAEQGVARLAALVAAGLMLAVASLQTARAAAPATPADAPAPSAIRWTAPMTTAGDPADAADAAEGVTPILLVSANPLDLGEVGAGAVAPGSLTVRNPGPDPLVIETMRPTCGCIRVAGDAFPLTLPPGGEARVRLTMDAAEEPGITKTKKLLILVRDHDTLSVPVIVRTTPLD